MIGLLDAAIMSQAQTGGATTTWNPLDKSGQVVLTNGNLTCGPTGGSGYGLVRATNAKSSGQLYFEIHEDTAGSSVFAQVGVCAASTALTGGYPGSDANGWGFYQQTGQKYHSATAATYGSAWALNDVIGVAVDFTLGKIWFAKNNTWQASGNPSAGTGEAFSGLSGALFPAMGIYCPNGGTFTARFKAASQTYAPPTGFSAWG